MDALTEPTPAPGPVPAEVAGPEPPAQPLPAGAQPPPDGPASGSAGDGSGEGHGHRGVAVLLGAAAVIAAIIGARATALSSEASDAWQSALRTEVKRAAGALADVRYLYQSELPPAITILGARLFRDELQKAAATESGATKQALSIEADTQVGLLGGLEPSSELATKPEYALESGGVDLGKRLAYLRGRTPDLVALDPAAIQASGDARSTKALAMTLAILPVSICAFLGAIAQPFARRRRPLLALGTVALAVGAAMAVGAEILG